MRWLVACALLAAGPARADGLLLEAGVGAPGGFTGGIGVREDAWQAFVEVGGAAAAFVGMLSGSVHIHRELQRSSQRALALGIGATTMGFLAGSDEVITGRIDTIGPSLEWRLSSGSRAEFAVDVGVLVGRCSGDCNSLFVMPEITLRFLWAR